jgi:hypothetical protein
VEPSRGTRFLYREWPVWIALLCVSLASLPLYTWSKVRCVNADDLSFLCYARDLFGSGYRVTDWCWCQSLYLLPDQLLFVPLTRLVRNPLRAYFAHSLCLFALQVGASAWLYSRLAEGRRNLLAFVSLQSLALVFLVHGQSEFPQRALSWIGWHGGVLVPGLVFLVAALHATRVSRVRPLLLAALLGLSFLSTLSDRLFVVQFAIPAAITWLWLAWRRQVALPRAITLSLLTLGAGALAMYAQSRLTPLGVVRIPQLRPVTWSERLDALLSLGEVLQKMGTAVPFSLLLLVVVLALCLRRITRRRLEAEGGEAESLEWDWVSMFYPWCILGSFLAPVYAGLLHTYDHSRFFYPIAIPGSLLLIAWWLRQPRQPSAGRLTLLPCCVLAFVAFLTLAPLPSVAKRYRKERLDLSTWGQAESLAKAIAAHDIKCGYAGFWEAKVLSVAHPGHRASQLMPGGTVFPWLTNLDYYFTDNHPELGRGIPCYEYLFLSQRETISLSHHPFWQRFGPPASVVQNGIDSVLIYNRPSDVGFRNFLRLPCLIEAKRPLPVSSTREELRSYKPLVTPSRSPNVVPAALNEAHLFPLERPMPVAGHVLELSLDFGDVYEVIFLRDNVEVGKAHLPSSAPRLHPGLNPFFLLVENHVQASTFDAVRVKPIDGDGGFAVGHLFVYPDSRVSERERRSPSGPDEKGVARSGAGS